MPTVPAIRVPRQRTTAATILVLVSAVLLLGSALSACEYAYEDDHWIDDGPSASAPPPTDAAVPNPERNRPVSGEELDDWADEVLPDPDEAAVLQSGYGSMAAGEARSETTPQLSSGSYSVTLACRSPARVSFTVRNGENTLVDLNLRCGTARVSVVYLAADTVLTVQAAGRAAANFAYSVTKI
jgi:hypothetical protein